LGLSVGENALFTKVEMNKYIKNNGKQLGSSHHSVPTSWKKGKTFLDALATRPTFIFVVSAITPSEKNDELLSLASNVHFVWRCCGIHLLMCGG